MSDQEYEDVAQYLLSKTSYRPVVGIICGSGLSGLSKSLKEAETFTYESIPGFPKATVPGHKGELVFGKLGAADIPCVCMRGRFHFYEGNEMSKVALPVRAMRLMGVKLLIVTNAAGGLNLDYNVGDIMVIQDHFGLPCLTGNNPLIGINDDALGPRFPSMSDAYDPALQDMTMDVAKSLKLAYKVRQDGTYCFVSGPCYESRAECRFLRSLGGDSVGMSTVPEVIAGKHAGMKVLGLSLITNKVVTSKEQTQHANHEEVLAAVEASGQHVEQIVRALMSNSMRQYLAALPTATYVATKTKTKTTKAATGSSIGSSGTGGDITNMLVTAVGLGTIIIGLYSLLKPRN